MKRYDEVILNSLIDKYETSSLYDSSNKKNISISQKIDKKTFPEYFDESSMKYREMHDQFENIEEKGLIKLHWKNHKYGSVLEKCELNICNVEAAYEYLKRNSKAEKITEAFNICKNFIETEDINELTKDYLKYIIQRLNDNKSPQRYLDINDTESFEKQVYLLNSILNNDEECFLREFSIKCTGNSKIAEKDISHLCSIIRHFSKNELFREANDEEILCAHGIVKNPVYIHIKGYGKFSIINTMIDLNCFDDGVGISGRDAEKIIWNKEYKPEIIITVENLTSFHKLKEKKYNRNILYIYLGGYHNSVQKHFIKNLFSAFPNAAYYHFGDIDCGGFMIWKNLVGKTGVFFNTIGMDETAYLNNTNNGRELTENDRKMLKKMKNDEFFHKQRNLFEMMLEKGIKTEQESVDIGNILESI